jgi:hypothetical protein
MLEAQAMEVIENPLRHPKDEVVFTVLRDGQMIDVVLSFRKAKAGEQEKPLPTSI